jgi:hypothetical protein
VHATVTLSESRSGTTIKLKCEYSGNQPYSPQISGDKPVWYQMFAISRSGERIPLSNWPSPQPGEDVVVDKMTHWPKSDIATIEVTTANGTTPVLRLDL